MTNQEYYELSLQGQYGIHCEQFAKQIEDGYCGIRPDKRKAKKFLAEAIKAGKKPRMVLIEGEGVFSNWKDIVESHLIFECE